MVKTTKRYKVQPDRVTPTTVQKAMSSGGSRMTEVMAHPRRLVKTVASTCSSHGKKTKYYF